MTDTANEIATSIRRPEGAVEVDATPVARGLKLPVEQLMVEMRRGIVYSTSERGIGEDEGRFRLTFRYRDRVFRLIVTTTGEVVSEDLIEELDRSCMLKERLRQALIDQAQTGNLTTYKELADRLGLEPPQTIHLIGEALETLMEDDVAAGRPMLAALCVSKMRPGILACGFFLAAQVLGAFLAIRRARRRVCLPRDRAAACAFILWKPASASGARCFVKKAIEIRGIEQVQQETMSFFERLKTEASAEWRTYTEHLSLLNRHKPRRGSLRGIRRPSARTGRMR